MSNEFNPVVSRTVDLGYDQLLVLQARPGTRVRVLYGSLWLTEEGLAQDVFAGSGEEVALKSRGLAVLEGLGVARVQVMRPGRARELMRTLGRWFAGLTGSGARPLPTGVGAARAC